MSLIPIILVVFISIFSGWVVFVMLDGANSILTFHWKSYFFRRNILNLFENPIKDSGEQRNATWDDVQHVARKYNLNRNQILFNLENMLSSALAAEKSKGQRLRKHHQALRDILSECENAKDFEKLPLSIQKHISSLKSNATDKQEHVFPFLESDILKLQEVHEKAFKREALKSHVSIILGVVSVLITLWTSYDKFDEIIKSFSW